MKGSFYKLLTAAIIVFTTGFGGIWAQTVNEVVETYNMGAEAMNDGELESAITYFEETVALVDEVGPDAEEYRFKAESVLPGLHYRLAMDAFKADEYKNAVEKMKETVEVAETYNDEGIKQKAESYIPQFLYAHGNQFYKAKEWDKAIAKYKQTVELDPEYINAYFRLALIYRNMNDNEKMIEYFDQVIENGPSGNSTVEKAERVLKAHFLKNAQQAINTNDFAVAADNLNNALKYGADEDVYYYLALSYNGMEEWDKAIENALKAVEMSDGSDSEKARFYYELARAYTGKGNTDSACEAYANAAHGKFEEAAKYQIEHVLNCSQ